MEQMHLQHCAALTEYIALTDSNTQVPLTSGQTSNQNSDGLDFDIGEGGKKKEGKAAGDSEAGSELEDGEILSETDNDEEGRQCVSNKGGNVKGVKSSNWGGEKLKNTSFYNDKSKSHGSTDNVDTPEKYDRQREGRERRFSHDSRRRNKSSDRERSEERRRHDSEDRKPARKPRPVVQKVEISDKSGPDNMLSLDLITKVRKQGVKTIHVPVNPPITKRPSSEESKITEDIAKKLEIETTLKSLIPAEKLQKSRDKRKEKDGESKLDDAQKPDFLQKNYTEALKRKALRHRQKNAVAKLLKPEIVIVAPASKTLKDDKSKDFSNVKVAVGNSISADIVTSKEKLHVRDKEMPSSTSKGDSVKESETSVAVESLPPENDAEKTGVKNQPPLPEESPPTPPQDPDSLDNDLVMAVDDEMNSTEVSNEPEKSKSTTEDTSQEEETVQESKSSDMLQSEDFSEYLLSGEESDAVSEKLYSGSDKEENDLYSMIFTGDSVDEVNVSGGGNSSKTSEEKLNTSESEFEKTLIEEDVITSSTPQKRKRSRSNESFSGDKNLSQDPDVPPQKKQRKRSKERRRRKHKHRMRQDSRLEDQDDDVGQVNDKSQVMDEDQVKVEGQAFEEEPVIDEGEESNTTQGRELDIIDDIADDQQNDDAEEGELLSDDEDEEMLDDSELHAMLEEGVDKSAQASDDDEPIYKEKVVLDEKGSDPFELMPEGWVVVTHNCGMPVYLHRQTRVCTMSRPYFLGPGSVRKHDIPLSSIPCMQYRRALKQEAEGDSGSKKPEGEGQVNGHEPAAVTSDNTKEKEVNGDQSVPERKGGLQVMDETGKLVPLPVKIECAEDSQKHKSLNADEVKEYCYALFHFKKITVKKFKTWRTRRRHLLRLRQQKPRPTLPSSTKLIKCTVPHDTGHGEEKRQKKKEFVLNPMGKSYVCILHEYAQHTLKVQPKYMFRELENAQTPYSATVIINDIMYGTGYASSKKNAKMEAAKNTLGILIPEMTKVIEESANEQEDLSFFDTIKIEDPRVYDLCNKAGQHSPYQILLECLKRNFGMGDTNCRVEVKPLKHQKSEYSLSVGKHTVSVVCKNKREGKQRAAQAMLQTLHPHIFSLGAILRLYGKSSWKSVKEKKKEEHLITELQSQAKAKRPNTALLEKLKEEMFKLQEQRKAIPSKGKFVIDTTANKDNVKTIDL